MISGGKSPAWPIKRNKLPPDAFAKKVSKLHARLNAIRQVLQPPDYSKYNKKAIDLRRRGEGGGGGGEGRRGRKSRTKSGSRLCVRGARPTSYSAQKKIWKRRVGW